MKQPAIFFPLRFDLKGSLTSQLSPTGAVCGMFSMAVDHGCLQLGAGGEEKGVSRWE